MGIPWFKKTFDGDSMGGTQRIFHGRIYRISQLFDELFFRDVRVLACVFTSERVRVCMQARECACASVIAWVRVFFFFASLCVCASTVFVEA